MVGLNEETEIEEGTWAWVQSAKEAKAAVKMFNKNKKITAADAADILYSHFGDDELFDDIGELEEKNPKKDIKKWVLNRIKKADSKAYDMMVQHGLNENTTYNTMMNVIVEAKERNLDLPELKPKYKDWKATSTDGYTRIYYKGKLVADGDFDYGADGYFINVPGEKGQRFFSYAADAIDYLKKKKVVKEEALNEARQPKDEYTLYHNSLTSAIQEAERYVKRKGYVMDAESLGEKVGLGPKKPSKGKTNSYHIDLTKGGKPQKVKAHIQVFNRGTPKNMYELNVYVS